jgi:hypothetical protein
MSTDLYNFDLFNFDDEGPSPEELAAEEERQEMMWTSYVNEMLTVLTEYVQTPSQNTKPDSHNGSSFTLSELLDTVLEIISEHVTSRTAEREGSRDNSTNGEMTETNEDTSEENLPDLPPVIASLYSAMPLFALALSGSAKHICLSALNSPMPSKQDTVVSSKAWDESKAQETLPTKTPPVTTTTQGATQSEATHTIEKTEGTK